LSDPKPVIPVAMSIEPATSTTTAVSEPVLDAVGARRWNGHDYSDG
jgi:hypothetical protein